MLIRLSADRQRTATVSARVEKRRKRGSSVVCYATPMLSVHTLQWISTISCVYDLSLSLSVNAVENMSSLEV